MHSDNSNNNFLLSTFFLSILIATPCHGEESFTLGFRGGFNATDRNVDFEQYEAFVHYKLPWTWRWSTGWGLDTRLDASAGALEGGDDTGFIGTIGPAVVLSRSTFWSLEIGVGFTYLSEDEFGRPEIEGAGENFGGEFQFSSHVGINYLFSNRWDLGYRFQHMSNADIEDPNPGLEMHLFQLGYRY